MKPPKPKPLWVALCNETGIAIEAGETRKALIEALECRSFHWVRGDWKDTYTIIKYIPVKKARKK